MSVRAMMGMAAGRDVASQARDQLAIETEIQDDQIRQQRHRLLEPLGGVSALR
jgi:hypothetical protein